MLVPGIMSITSLAICFIKIGVLAYGSKPCPPERYHTSPATCRSILQTALRKSGLDPFAGSDVQDHVAFIPCPGLVDSNDTASLLTARHAGMKPIPTKPGLRCLFYVIVTRLPVYPDMGIVRSIREIVVAGS